MSLVSLDVYRSCSRREKRRVLTTFWHSNVEESARITQGALEYGPYAALCLSVIAIELFVVVVVALDRASHFAWLAVFAEVVALLSLWWSVVRWRDLRGPRASDAVE